MPSRWTYATRPGEVEDAALAAPIVQDTSGLSFDGFWEATMMSGEATCSTTVIISGDNVWHDGSFWARLKVINEDTCVLIMDADDIKGHLAEDRSAIDWEDGDCWQRVTEEEPGIGTKDCDVSASRASAECDAASPAAARVDTTCSTWCAEAALRSLLSRDAKALHDLFLDGMPADLGVDPAKVWKQIRWEPQWAGKPPMTPLLVAAILLQWPEGVEVCVQHGADVNCTYTGPFPTAGGSSTSETCGAPLLRVALSAQGPAQCTICQHLLGAKVRGKTFQTVKKKAKAEMDFVTRSLFHSFQGPFREG
eukprot:TRINITY_DN82745_c0_g1_i1.p1 TRINITY_DN82745_c0_g1~~TRINITY_DN82745_c0_g1_i1.p1  ORF type:complete len:308 (+),score=62.39 TRINITY_DN82745_c0_g1_i1:48-971(+)